MLRSALSRPTILVTDAGRGSAITIIRSLGRRGWRVIAADARPRSAGFRSRYAHDQLVYPPPESAPRQFVETLLDAVRRHGVDLIIPVTDAAILPIAEARAEFDALCRVAIPPDAALESVTNKAKTLDIAKRLGVPIPRTHTVTTVEQAIDHGSELGWPVVLKPQVSRLHHPGLSIEKLSVVYAENEIRLAEQMGQFASRCPVLLQEYCVGEGYGVELLMHEGRPLAAFAHRRLREMPLHGGPSALRESVALDPVLYQQSVALLREIGWEGLAMVEFKVGPRGIWLMEINGRVWGSLPLAVHAGIDFPARLVELWLLGANGVDSEPDSAYQLGVRSHNLELELKWIFTVLWGKRRVPFLPMPQRQAGLVALAQLFHPAYKYDILAADDPIPGLADIARMIGREAARLVRRRSTCD